MRSHPLAGWACLMAVMGPWAAITSQAGIMNSRYKSSQFVSVNFVDILGFLVLLAWGIALRRNPAAHRRMMILATISLADPGFSRFSGYLWPVEPHSFLLWFFYNFYGNVLLIGLMACWGWWRGRLLRSFVAGAAGGIGGGVGRHTLVLLGAVEDSNARLGRDVGEALQLVRQIGAMLVHTLPRAKIRAAETISN